VCVCVLVGSLVTAKVYNNRKVFCALGQPANCRTGPYIPLCPESVFTSAENARMPPRKARGDGALGGGKTELRNCEFPNQNANHC